MGKKTKEEIYIYSHMVKEQFFSMADIERYHDEAIERNEILSYFCKDDMTDTEFKKLLFESFTNPLRSFEKDGEIWVECRFICITDKGRVRTYKEQDEGTYGVHSNT